MTRQCQPGCCIRARVCANSSSLLSISERVSREILELAVVEPVQGDARGVTLVAGDHRREEAVVRRRPRASKIAVRQANGLVAEVGMVVSIVMAIFFQRVAGTR